MVVVRFSHRRIVLYKYKNQNFLSRPQAAEDEKSMKNDEGIAYGLIAVVMFIGMVALIFICFTPALNGVIGAANDLIGDGKVGVQTAGAVEWSLGWFAAIPIIGLLGIGYWSYIRALEENPND